MFAIFSNAYFIGAAVFFLLTLGVNNIVNTWTAIGVMKLRREHARLENEQLQLDLNMMTTEHAQMKKDLDKPY